MTDRQKWERRRHLAAAIAFDGRRQYVIAREAGMAAARLSQIVNGRVCPTPEEAARIAAVLYVPTEVVYR